MNNLFRMRELIELINNADKAYFGEDKPIMTDKEYDALVEELTNIEIAVTHADIVKEQFLNK